MRVLVAHNRYRSALPSGENAVVAADVAMLRDAGVQVRSLLPSSDDIDGLPFGRRAGIATSPVLNPAGVRELRAVFRDFRPDVLHVHNVVPHFSPWVVRSSHAAGVPVVQTVHNYRHSCVSGFRFRDGHPCDDCVGRLLPVPAVVHSCYRGSTVQSAAMAAGQFAHRGTWRSVDRFLALTSFQAGELVRLGINAARVSVRPTAAPDPGPPTPPGRNVLFVGRLDEMKGAQDLLAAWARTDPPPGARLRIVGEGPLLKPLWRTAACMSTVDLLGRLDADGVAAEMRDAALVALPSLWYEGMPRVLVEALGHGRPVLVHDIGGLPVDDHDRLGWAAPVGGLAKTLDVLHNREVLREKGIAARERYLDRHTPAAATDSLLAAYRDVTGR
jgi:glycosyltransferase involved in cell wall biosynthesis